MNEHSAFEFNCQLNETRPLYNKLLLEYILGFSTNYYSLNNEDLRKGERLPVWLETKNGDKKKK